MKSKRIIPVFFILILSLFPTLPFVESAEYREENKLSGEISFQPSEIPNIEFSYNPNEYQFELTWKTFYLNINPYAIYNGQRYELKQIIPFLRNQYPNIEYRSAIQKFKNYHRWGYFLEKLPQNVADNLDYLGFDVSDTNIPLNKVHIEESEGENFTYKMIQIANKITFDFYDLYERGFSVDINKTDILIGNVRGKTDLDLDPITYAPPIITVTGFPAGTPCTFWDIWNASNVNGWNVASNNNNTDNQFEFNAQIRVGNGVDETYLNDTLVSVHLNWNWPNGEELIDIWSKGHLTLGVLENSEKLIVSNGITLSRESGSTEVDIIYCRSGGSYHLYGSHLIGDNETWTDYSDISFGSSDSQVIRCLLQNVRLAYSRAVFRNNMILDPFYAFYAPTKQGIYVDNVIMNKGGGYGAMVRVSFPDSTFTRLIVRGFFGLVWMHDSTENQHVYFVDTDTDTWKMGFGAVANGTIWRQNTFNVMVVDKDGLPIQNADVTLTYSSQGGGIAYSGSTYANGSISEQIISKGFYNQTGGDIIYLYEPYTLNIEATDYLPQTLIFNVSNPIIWEIPLLSLEDGVTVTNIFNFSENIWITIIIYVLTIIIGYLKQDAILHLISFVIGIALMIEFLSTNLYLGFSIAILSIYIAYYALWIEWPERD